MRQLICLVALVALSLLPGCEPAASPPAPPSVPPTSAYPRFDHAAERPTAATNAAVTLDIKSWDETLALVAQHKGKVVVLDVWSTACEPCMHEFPNLVNLSKRHGSDKLICMSASCDFIGLKGKPPETYKPQVLEFLQKQGAAFPNVLLNVEPEVLFEKIELASIPAVYVFGPDGEIAKRFDNDNAAKPEDEFNYAKDIVPFVGQLLAK